MTQASPGTPATLTPPRTSILLCSSMPTTKTMFPLLFHGGVPPLLPSLSPSHVLSLLQIKSSAAAALCLQVATAAGETRRRVHTPWIRGKDWVKGTRI